RADTTLDAPETLLSKWGRRAPAQGGMPPADGSGPHANQKGDDGVNVLDQESQDGEGSSHERGCRYDGDRGRGEAPDGERDGRHGAVLFQTVGALNEQCAR